MLETGSENISEVSSCETPGVNCSGKRIVICGNIGVGKTTLCEMLAQEIKGTIVQEKFADNPYLEPYYTELRKNSKPNKYAIGSQLYFLKETYNAHQIPSEAQTLIFDRSIHENIGVFAESLISMGIMSELDSALYRKTASDYLATFKGYDVFIYLKASEEKLMSRIRKRGREMEVASIDSSYLAQLNKLYDATFDSLKEKEEIIVLDTTESSEKEILVELMKQLQKKTNN